MSLNIKNEETCSLASRLARLTGELLLFKGRDFARTDIGAALSPEAENPTR